MLTQFQEFVSKYNFDAFTINKIETKKNKDGIYKKIPQFMPSNWKDCNNIDLKHSIGCVKTGKVSGISVLDFDCHKQYDAFFMEYPQLKNTLTIRTYKGYHCFYKYSDKMPCNTGCFKHYKGGIYDKIDGRNDGNFVFSVGSRYYHNGLSRDITYDLYRDYDILQFDEDTLSTLSTKKPNQTKNDIDLSRKNAKQQQIPECVKSIPDEISRLGELIKIEHLDDYTDWVNIIISLRALGGESYHEYAKYLSMKSSKYDDKTFNDLWEYYDDKQMNYNARFYEYAKLGDTSTYYKIRSEYINIISSLDSDMVHIAIELFGKKFIIETKGDLHFYNGVFWENDSYESKLNNYIKVELVNFYNSNRIKLLNTIKQILNIDPDTIDDNKFKEICNKKKLDEYDQETQDIVAKIKIIDTCINKCKTTKNQNDLRSQFKKDIWCKDIKWESNPELFCFNDKVYNLKSGDFINPSPEHYIYMNTRYNYKEPKPEHETELMEILNTILPIKEELEYYLLLLSTGLIGNTLEKFIISNGSGRNGKGVLHDLFLTLLGDYGYKMNNSILLKPLEVGTCPELANCENKRFIITNEPSENKQFELSTIKDLTGSAVITARTHYSTKTQLNNKGTFICEVNKRPPINGRIDNAAKERLIDILFRSEFVDNEEDTNPINYKYIKNPSYKSDLFKQKYKYALFKILARYAKQYLNNNCKLGDMPLDIQNRTNSYLEDNDKYTEFINQCLEKTDNKMDRITIKQLLEKYKDTEHYARLSNKEKTTIKLSSFKEMVNNHLTLKEFYKTINGINYILYYKFI